MQCICIVVSLAVKHHRSIYAFNSSSYREDLESLDQYLLPPRSASPPPADAPLPPPSVPPHYEYISSLTRTSLPPADAPLHPSSVPKPVRLSSAKSECMNVGRKHVGTYTCTCIYSSLGVHHLYYGTRGVVELPDKAQGTAECFIRQRYHNPSAISLITCIE